MRKTVIATLLILLTASGCVSKKKYNSQVARVTQLSDTVELVIHQLDQCLADKTAQNDKIESLQAEIVHLKATGNALLNQLSDLSVITKAQSESIKKSLENLSSKDAYIKDLHIEMARKDSINMALVMNLKGALVDVNDEDVEIKME
jgi:chemotaxis protein MotB